MQEKFVFYYKSRGSLDGYDPNKLNLPDLLKGYQVS